MVKLLDSSLDRASQGWQGERAAERYVGPRFRTAGAAGRDGKLVARLARRLALPSTAIVLDVPCGTGRLSPTLIAPEGFYVGVDVSAAMLRQARTVHDAPLLQASAAALPFADSSFDVVVCCRLLHHLRDDERAAVLRELVRVSRRFVVASFFDSGSWAAWRRSIGVRRQGRSRRSVGRRAIEHEVAAAGARIARYAHSLRFVSQQVFFAAVKLDAPTHR